MSLSTAYVALNTLITLITVLFSTIWTVSHCEYKGDSNKYKHYILDSDDDDEYYEEEYENEEEEEENNNYMIIKQDYTESNNSKIEEIDQSIDYWEKKIEEYKEKRKIFEDPNYHLFEEDITNYIKVNTNEKFIIICENYINHIVACLY